MPAVGVHGALIFAVLVTIGVGSAVWWHVTSTERAPGRSVFAALAMGAAALVIVIGTLPGWPREVFAAGIGFFAPRYEDKRSGTLRAACNCSITGMARARRSRLTKPGNFILSFQR